MTAPSVLLARSLTVVAALLGACDSGNDDTARPEGDADVDTDTDVDTGPTDADGDGWTVAAGDCDDGNPDVHPESLEGCNGVDDDCDGTVDEGFDADVDGWTTCGGDCDDGDPHVHPDAGEATADGVDQDCDGGDDCFVDADEDGFGTLETVTSKDLDCEDAGESPSSTDCDDTDPTVSPGAEEVCGDEIDNDCDGGPGGCTLSGDIPLSDADAILLGGEPPYADLAGSSVSAGDVDGDGIDDVIVGAPYAESDGRVYVVPGPVYGTVDLSLVTTVLEAERLWSGVTGDRVLAEDMDGDGISDVIVGDKYYGFGLEPDSPGTVYLVLGPLSGAMSLSEADAKMVGEGEQDWAGCSIGAGDVNGDGLGDVLVGAFGADAGGEHAGAAYLLLGPTSGYLNLSAADAGLVGEDIFDLAGWSVAAGDVDGDGFDDVLVGARWDDTTATGSGAVYVVHGPIIGSFDLSDADAKLLGEQEHALAGESLAAGDGDGDGLDDILVGSDAAPLVDLDDGTVYLVHGAVVGERNLSTAECIFTGEEHGDAAGQSVNLDDVDNDGFGDVLIGATGSDTGATHAGSAYLVFGSCSGTVPLGAADAKFIGEFEDDWAGRSIAVGDVNADGLGDVLVGAVNDSGYTGGKAYLLYGGGL